MANEMDRLFDQLQAQSRLLGEQGQMLATITQSQRDTHERLFGNGGTQGSIPYLHAEVSKHGRQITFWKGAFAVLTFLWTVAMAFATAVYSHHK